MRWDKYLPKLEALERKGRTIKALQEAPQVAVFLTPIWDAFIELHNRRQIGFEMNPISIGAIKDWLDFRGYEDNYVREFVFNIICYLDNQWRKLSVSKKKKKKEVVNG